MDAGEPTMGETDLDFFDIETVYQDRPGSSGDRLGPPSESPNPLDDPYADLSWDLPEEAPHAFCEPPNFGLAEDAAQAS